MFADLGSVEPHLRRWSARIYMEPFAATRATVVARVATAVLQRVNLLLLNAGRARIVLHDTATPIMLIHMRAARSFY
jgi:hypothetical protein